MRGSVSNDGQGVTIHVCGAAAGSEAFVAALTSEAPLRSRVDRVNQEPAASLPTDAAFRIIERSVTGVSTGVLHLRQRARFVRLDFGCRGRWRNLAGADLWTLGDRAFAEGHTTLFQ